MKRTWKRRRKRCVEIEFICNFKVLFLIDGARRKGRVQ